MSLSEEQVIPEKKENLKISTLLIIWSAKDVNGIQTCFILVSGRLYDRYLLLV